MGSHKQAKDNKKKKYGLLGCIQTDRKYTVPVWYSVLLWASLPENLIEMQLTKCLVGLWFQLRLEVTSTKLALISNHSVDIICFGQVASKTFLEFSIMEPTGMGPQMARKSISTTASIVTQVALEGLFAGV